MLSGSKLPERVEDILEEMYRQEGEARYQIQELKRLLDEDIEGNLELWGSVSSDAKGLCAYLSLRALA